MRIVGILVGIISSFSVFSQSLQTINPLIADSSYYYTFGEFPAETTPEQVRIFTHLSYVEQRLRMNNGADLTEDQQAKRMVVLNHLRDYCERGEFPINSKFEHERRPCFIDENGTICAVGYLIEQTESRSAAEAINEVHQYDVIAAMNSKQEELQQWAEKNGLTLKECAMIQPTYQTMIRMKKNYFGIYGGYATTFVRENKGYNAGSLQFKPGFEAGFAYRRHLRKRWCLQTGIGYTSKRYAVTTLGQTINFRNDRLAIPLLISFPPFFNKGPHWLRKFNVRAGVQVEFTQLRIPSTIVDLNSGITSSVVSTNQFEMLGVFEMGYILMPISRNFLRSHAISVAWSQGLIQSYSNEISMNNDPVSYKNNYSGTYLSFKYTVWLDQLSR